MSAPLQSWLRSPLSLSRLAAGLRSPHRLRAAHASSAPVPPADPAIAPRQARAQATSRLGDTARNPLSRPAAPPASRRLAIAADPATSRPAATRVATCAAPAPPRARHLPHLAPPRGSRCGSGNSREMVR